MKAHGRLSAAVLLAVVIMNVGSAHAIITRDDLPDSAYLVADADYPALVDLVSPGDCIATLVHESFLVTVAHCAVDVKVGKLLFIGGNSYKVDKVFVHPKWKDSRDEYDIALVRLERPVHEVAPLPIYRETQELNSIITLFGRGLHATGLVGEKGAKDDFLLRRATNRVSAVNKYFIEIFFERPGDAGVTDLEGVGAAGDSGGPSFIEVNGVPQVAGLNSWGEGGGGVGVGQYGSRDYQTRISRYVDWLDQYLDPAILTKAVPH